MLKDNVYTVFWLEVSKIDSMVSEPRCKGFTGQDMKDALVFCESLRKEQTKTGLIRFVTMASENSNCTSLAGATVMAHEDYKWKKRRV
jgi:hypothetical protein